MGVLEKYHYKRLDGTLIMRGGASKMVPNHFPPAGFG